MSLIQASFQKLTESIKKYPLVFITCALGLVLIGFAKGKLGFRQIAWIFRGNPATERINQVGQTILQRPQENLIPTVLPNVNPLQHHLPDNAPNEPEEIEEQKNALIHTCPFDSNDEIEKIIFGRENLIHTLRINKINHLMESRETVVYDVVKKEIIYFEPWDDLHVLLNSLEINNEILEKFLVKLTANIDELIQYKNYDRDDYLAFVIGLNDLKKLLSSQGIHNQSLHEIIEQLGLVPCHPFLDSIPNDIHLLIMQYFSTNSPRAFQQTCREFGSLYTSKPQLLSQWCTQFKFSYINNFTRIGTSFTQILDGWTLPLNVFKQATILYRINSLPQPILLRKIQKIELNANRKLIDFGTLADCPHLQTLILENLENIDLSQIKSVINLEIHHSFNSLLSLSELPQLQKLTINDCDRIDEQAWEGLPNLTSLAIIGCKCSNPSFLSRLTALTKLNLFDSVPINDKLFSHLPSLSNLSELTLATHTKPCLNNISSISMLTTIEKLALCNFSNLNSIQFLIPLTKLNVLNLSRSPLFNQAFDPISTFTQLKSLTIDPFGGFPALNQLTQMKQLHISGSNTFVGVEQKWLDQLGEVEELSLQNNYIFSPQLGSLASLEKLKKLTLRNCRDFDLKATAQLTRLQELIYDQVQEGSYLELKTHTTLTKLCVRSLNTPSLLELMKERPDLEIAAIPNQQPYDMF